MSLTQFYTIYLFIIQGTWEITCSADFNTLELDHLSEKLHPAECMKLLEAMYSQTPSSSLTNEKESSEFQNSSQYCRIKLGEWNRTFPEAGLRTLGRPDLANYVKRSRRLVDILNNVINAQASNEKSKYLHRRESLTNSVKMKGRKNKSFIPPGAAHTAVKTHLSASPVSKIEHHNQEMKKHFIAQANKKQEPKEVRLQDFGMRSEAVARAPGSQTQADHHHPLDEPSPTRWIAFGIFILLIVITILITAVIAIYKNRGHFPWESGKGKKTCDDRCPLTDHFQKVSEVEHGWTTSSTDYMGTRWRRGSSMASSRSPSLICVKESKKRARRIKRQRDKQQQTTRLEKKRKRKEVKGKKKKRVSKETGKNELSLREKIVNILRKDKPDCKCCKCSFGEDDGGNHQVCNDDHCKERRIVNLTDLYSTTRAKTPKKQKKSRKSKERKKSKDRKDSKDRRISSPESSPRERKDSRFRDTLARMRERSPRWSLDHHDPVEPCTKLTCDARRSPRDRNSVDFDDTYQSDHQNQKSRK
ncbi:uncharacterized protein LOC135163551 isoform X2 [Diachasmimorpha longicaudata]|uniref:uncharacterized protein LOC135163551 isoform X2 n=1 Tax=Diachasmimorpha longicaudata TaxID=58733 RepID=UPI0030B90548